MNTKTKMKMRNEIIPIAIVAALVTACDRNDRTFHEERTSRLYQTAMAEYRAGRMKEAVSGFEKVVGKDPLNTSARFQLASLQQDFSRDYLAAFCNFREYIQQAPDSDKAKMADDRMKLCERELARVLSEKYALSDKNAEEKLVKPLEDEIKKRDLRIAEIEKSLADSQRKNAILSAERDRLVKMIRSTGADEKLENVSLKDVKALLEEEDEELAAATDTDDVSDLKAEGEAEKELSSSLLPKQTEEAKAAHKRRNEGKGASNTPARPSEYTVQEGDTLYKIAIRFYGRTSAWREIRDANKAQITTDGRVKTGDVIKLP